jgi:ketosteroid isomerase-like protein
MQVERLYDESMLNQRGKENLDVVQKLISAHHEGSLQTFSTYLTNDSEWRSNIPEGIPTGGVYRGPQEVSKFLDSHKKLFDVQWEKHEQVVAQGDLLIIIGRERVRITTHGKMWESDFVLLFTFRDGKIAKFYAFSDSIEFLKAYQGEDYTLF